MNEYCKVLIIDDEFITRQGIKHMLLWEQEGFRIVGEASNGQEGLEMIEKYQPDIVLADIVMPVLNGIDFSLILQEKYPDIKLIVLSSYDNFEYVRTTLLNGAVDYVLKPTLNPEILLNALKKAVRNIPGFHLDRRESVSVETQLERYLAGYQEHLDEEVLESCFPYMHYRILAVNMKKACKNNGRQMEQIPEMFRDMLQREGFAHYQTIWLQQEILCFLFNYRKKQEEVLLAGIRETAQRAGRAAEKALFVLSSPFTDFTQLREIYEKGVKPCLDQKFYFSGRPLIAQEEYHPGEVKRFHYEKYTELLKDKQYMQALGFLEEYIRYLAGNQYDEYLSKNLLKNLLYSFLAEIEKYGAEIDRLRGDYFRRIDDADSVEKFFACISLVFEQLGAVTEKMAGALQEDERIARIKGYINSHYSEKLELADIAREFSFNYHYISSYFNQYIAEGFSGYLNMVRIEKSCALLRESSVPISDVSVAVGYSDHGYFCRMFKKRMGQTPSQYRRSAKRGGSDREEKV